MATGGQNTNEAQSRDFREMNSGDDRESLGYYIEEGISQVSSGNDYRFMSSGGHVSHNQRVKVNVTMDHRKGRVPRNSFSVAGGTISK